MPRVRDHLKKHTLWIGFAAALIPLILLLVLQYVWLSRLEETTAVAHRAALSSCVRAVGEEVRHFYRGQAEANLLLPSSLFVEELPERVAAWWAKEQVEGVRRRFVVDYTRAMFGDFLFFDEEREVVEVPPASDEALAVIVAATPWQVLRYRGMVAEKTSLTADERDLDHRILLHPVTDEDSRVVGVAGLIVDEKFVREELLPAVIERMLARYFPDLPREDLLVTVRDGEGGVVFPGGAEIAAEDEAPVVSAPLPLLFTDWVVGITSRGQTPEQWARAGFAFNMGLSVLLALTLLAGVVLALREADRAMRLSEMKSDFVSNVSHELRTPIASIRVFAEFLKLGHAERPEKVRQYGEHIEAESRRLSRLIENILDFSRIESGRKSYEFSDCDLEGVVVSVVDSFRLRVGERGFRIDLQTPRQPVRVNADTDAMSQALNNLLDNAVKYSGDSREIDVRLERDKDSAVCSVADRGVGIAREEQRKIFERFHRVGSSLLHDVKGSGLGLSIVQHIVRAHRGETTVESEPGKGTVFRIRLPLASSPDAPGQREE